MEWYVVRYVLRFGKGDSGLVGVTLQPKSLKTWAYSLHSCSFILHDLRTMSEEVVGPRENMVHKEEMPA